MTKTHAIVKDATKFTISGYLSSICNLVSATIVRRILDPFFMGIYSELMLIFDYAKYSNLGMLDALDRQIPYYNGKNDIQSTEEAKDIGGSFTLFVSLIGALAISGYSLIFASRLSRDFASGLYVIALMLVIQAAATFYVTVVRAHHLFGPLSRYVIFVAVFDILFKALLGAIFGLQGILWATVATLSIGAAYLYLKAGIGVKIIGIISVYKVKMLLGIGFPLLLSSFAFMVLRSVDRLAIIAFLTSEDLGLYSIAVMAHSFVFQLPNLIYTVLFPRFYEAFGNTEEIGKLKGFLEKPTMAFAYVFPALIGASVIMLPLFINYVLPKYTAGILPASILLFGTFFISITNMSGYLLVAVGKQKVLVIIGGFCVLISAVLNTISIKVFNSGIGGVAFATSLAYFLYSLILIGYAMGHYVTRSIYERIKFFAEIYLPLVWVIAVLSILRIFFRYGFRDIGSDMLKVSFELAVFFALLLPLFLRANRKTAIFARFLELSPHLLKR